MAIIYVWIYVLYIHLHTTLHTLTRSVAPRCMPTKKAKWSKTTFVCLVAGSNQTDSQPASRAASQWVRQLNSKSVRREYVALLIKCRLTRDFFFLPHTLATHFSSFMLTYKPHSRSVLRAQVRWQRKKLK